MQVKKGYKHDGSLFHFSAGAIIERDGKYLLIDRVHFPLGFAAPEGHVDEAEPPLKAIKREIKEETGLEVIKATIIKEQFVPWNECHLGIKGHYWYLFKCEAVGEPVHKKREAKSIGWYTPSQIRKLKLEKVWKHWFTQLKII